MSKLRELQRKKLLKELEYIELELEYTMELIGEADLEFNKEIGNFLEKNPEIKEAYNQRIDVRIQNVIESKIVESTGVNCEETGDVITKPTIDKKVTKLYREIVKATHPDIVSKKSLNDIYIWATKCYDLGDKIGIYKICQELNIDYEIDEVDEKDISDKVSQLKERLIFMESTFALKWFKIEDEVLKNQIMIDFIKLMIK